MSSTGKLRRVFALLMTCVVPAGAQSPEPLAGVAAFRGGAEITEWDPVNDVCTNDPDGLSFPHLSGKEACWTFGTDMWPGGPPPVSEFCVLVGVGFDASGDLDTANAIDDSCSIQADGRIGMSLLGGAWCGHSEGHSGTGTFEGNNVTLDLSGVGWAASVGSFFVVQGQWDWEDDVDPTRTASGELAGLVNALGNSAQGNDLAFACLGVDLFTGQPTDGATRFDVNAVVALIQT